MILPFVDFIHAYLSGKAKEIDKIFKECENQLQKLQEEFATEEEKG